VARASVGPLRKLRLLPLGKSDGQERRFRHELSENRLIGVGSGISYVYNGQGQRVEKNLSGVKTDYLYDLASHVVTAFQSAGTWQRGEIYAGGWHLGTYYPNATYFSFTDWLGTEHYRTDNLGNLYQTCYNLPFGDGQTCAGTDVSPLHFTGKELDSESGLDSFGFRHYASTMGRFMTPDPAGRMAVDIASPQTLNRYAYVLNNPLGFIDPFGLDCAYLTDSGKGVESVDQGGTSGECGKTGGYWVQGGITDAQINSEAGTVNLTGTTNGTDNNTHASYQDTTVFVGMYFNTPVNPLDHIGIGVGNSTPFGLNPKSDSLWFWYKMIGNTGGVPGVVKPEKPGGFLDRSARIPVTGMQAQMVQSGINQGVQNPPNYDTSGAAHTCDCASWPQQVLGDAGINTGRTTQIPNQLMNQVDTLYPQQQ